VMRPLAHLHALGRANEELLPNAGFRSRALLVAICKSRGRFAWAPQVRAPTPPPVMVAGRLRAVNG
jgi:hypothetical protein